MDSKMPIFSVPTGINAIVTLPNGKAMNTRTKHVNVFSAEERVFATKDRAAFVRKGFRLEVHINALRVSFDVLRLLLDGIKTLAGRCDYAHKLDGSGFNRVHARRGHKLADADMEAVTNMTHKEIQYIAFLCVFYKRQLPANIVEAARLIQPPKTECVKSGKEEMVAGPDGVSAIA